MGFDLLHTGLGFFNLGISKQFSNRFGRFPTGMPALGISRGTQERDTSGRRIALEYKGVLLDFGVEGEGGRIGEA
jgi:hypothetical protein